MISELKKFLILFRLSENYKFKLFFLFILAAIETVLEIFLILLIPIILSIVLSENLNLSEFFLIAEIKNIFFTDDPYKNIIISIILVFIKTTTMSVIYYLRNNILVEMRSNTYSNLLDSYLKKNISSFTQNISALALRNLTTEVNFIYQRFIGNYISVISDLLLLISFLVYLLFLDFYAVSILILIFSFTSLLIRYFTNNLLIKSSSTQLKFDGKWSNSVSDIFSLIREINIYSVKNYFFNSAKNYIWSSSKYHNNIKFVPQVSRQIFEMIAILFFFFVIYANMSNNIFNFILITKLSIFVGCFFRILPTTQRLVVAFQTIRSSKSNVDNYLRTIEKNKLNDNTYNSKEIEIVNFKNRITLENINFKYDNKNIIKNFNLKILKGDRCAILGKTGTGKSTLTDLIMGILKPDNGNIYFDDTNVNGMFEKIKHNFSYIPQEVYLLNKGVKDNIIFFDETFNETFFNNLINDLELSDLYKRFDDKNLSVGDNGSLLSAGQKQRIGLGRALYSNREIIVLDEPSSNLDVQTENRIFKKILEKFKEKTFIIISHNESLSSLCEKKITMD